MKNWWRKVKTRIRGIHVYHVCYIFQSGSGTMTMVMQKPIRTINNIKRTAQYIQENTILRQTVSIISWTEMKPMQEDYEMLWAKM